MTESFTLTALSWLATYLVHSTLLIGCVWAFTGACSFDSLTRSLLWKLALVGGLFTATLQTGLGVQPALGLLTLSEPEAPMELAPPVHVMAEPEQESMFISINDSELLLISGSQVLRIDEQGPCIGPGCEIPEWVSPGLGMAGLGDETFTPGEFLLTISEPHHMPSPPMMPMMPMLTTPESPAVVADEPVGESGAAWLLGLFVAGAGASLLRLGFMARALKRSLRGRTPLLVGPLHERLAALVARARIRRMPLRLTVSSALRSPVALANGEIVVPPEALELEARQQEAMLAHELAHVLRRDPAWLVLAAVIEALLFIQPLNRVARRGMQEAAEELSDDWAVRHIGSGLHLARCLTEVAGWLERGSKRVRLASPMASEGGSLLVRRVRRLLAPQPGARGRLAGASRVLLGLGLLLAVALGAPGFAPPLAMASSPELPVAPAPPAVPELPVMAVMPDMPEVPAVPFMASLAAHDMPVLAARSAARRSDETDVQRGAAVESPSGRERRLARRASRLERRAEKLRERSGTGEPPRQVFVLRAEDVGATLPHIRGIDREQLQRLVADARRIAVPSEQEMRRIEADARKVEADVRRMVAPSAAKMRRIEADARRIEADVRRMVVPSAAEIRRIEADARRIEADVRRMVVPSAAEIRRIEADARRIEADVRSMVMPSEKEIRQIEADAQRIAERAARAIEREAEGMAASIEREAEQMAAAIERELHREFGRMDDSEQCDDPQPPQPRGMAPMAPMAPMPPMPPMAPMPPGAGPRGRAMPPMPPGA
ncbi:MAG: hypothetical protein H0T76_14660, partial [Nannocystis sp.]